MWGVSFQNDDQTCHEIHVMSKTIAGWVHPETKTDSGSTRPRAGGKLGGVLASVVLTTNKTH